MALWILALWLAALAVPTAPLAPTDAKVALERARHWQDEGDLAQAARELERALPAVERPETAADLRADYLLTYAECQDALGLHDDATARRTQVLPALDTLLTNHDFAALDVVSRLVDVVQPGTETKALEPRLAGVLDLVRGDPARALAQRTRMLRFFLAMGGAMQRLGHPDVATTLLNQALQFVDPDPQVQKVHLAYLSIRLGELQEAQGNLAQAQKFFTYALTNLTPVWGADHPRIASLHRSLATVLLRLGDREGAWQHLQAQRESRQRLQNVLRDAALPQSVKIQALQADLYADELLMTLALERAQTSPEAAADLVAIVLRRKGALLETLLPHGDDHPTPQVRDLRKKLQESSARLAQAWLQHAGEVPTPQTLADRARLEKERDRLESELAAASPTYRAEKRELTLPALCKALPRGGGLLEYVHFASVRPLPDGVRLTLRYAGVLVRKDGCGVTVHDLGEAVPVRTLVQTWRKVLTRGGRGAAALDDPQQTTVDADAVARQLYAAVWAPFAANLAGLDVLLVAPDDQLRFVPFAALPTPQGKLLLDEVPMAQIASGREVLRLVRLPAVAGKGALVLAAPEFGEGPAHAPSSTPNCAWRQSGWPPLPGTKTEAEQVQAMLLAAHHTVTLRLGKDATEAALRGDVVGKRYVELATHGWFADESCAGAQAVERNPLLLSGLVLAGANRPAERDQDGWLTAAEVAGLDLSQAQLVVLSACETGLGQTRTALGEGVFGLERAVLQAGARSVVLSLWQVADEETAALMQRFWQGVLVRKVPSWKALVEAQRGLRAELLKTRGVADPGLWAAFVHVGAW